MEEGVELEAVSSLQGARCKSEKFNKKKDLVHGTIFRAP
jgi:hypothetical protein